MSATDLREDEAVPCRLYLITPPRLVLDDFAALLAETLSAGDVACLQLRLKDVDDTEIVRAGERLLPIAQERGVAFVVNDRPDLAVTIGADGAHVGQEDCPALDARRLLGPDRILGVTAHNSRHLAMLAAEQGADYVAFGAFYPSRTKIPKTSAEPELLAWWSGLFEVPCVAIGGITLENASVLVHSGADFLAVSGGVWEYAGGPAKAVAEFSALFASTRRAAPGPLRD